MVVMVKKTDLAREAYRRGNVKEALRIAKTFRIGLTKEDRDAIIRGYECLVHPEFYRMLGKDPEEEIEKGKKVFEKKILV
jgi:hypothetical protein